MSWTDALKIIFSALVSVGGAGGLIAIVVKFSSNLIAERLSQKYQLDIQKALEKYKAGIESKTYISKARFDREFSMYQELCEKNITMVYDMGAAVMITRGAEYPNVKSTHEFVHLALQHIDDADMTNKRYAPFIAKEIFESYKELEKQALSIISLLDLWDRLEKESYTTVIYNGKKYTNMKAKNEIEEKQKVLSRFSDDILDKLRNYLSNLDALEDK